MALRADSQSEDLRKTETDIKIEDRFVRVKLLTVEGKKSEAIKLLDSLRRESEPNASIFFELAKLHYQSGDINLTESNLKSAVKLAPDNEWIRMFEVNFDKDLGRFDEAIHVLNELSAGQPKKLQYYDLLVALYIKKNNWDAAIKTIDTKEKNIGFSTNNILKKAEILDNAGRLDDAVKVLNILVNKYPSETKYLRLIANMLHSNDKIAATEPYLKKILEIDPSDDDAKFGLLLLSKTKISKDDYLNTLYPLIVNPDAPIDLKIKELIPYIQKHASTGDSILGVQLISLCDKLVIAHPNEAKAHAIYGDVLKNNQQLTAAIRQYEKTLTLNNKNFLVWEQLMYCLDESQNSARLLKVAEDAIDLFPNQAISYYFAGKTFVIQNDFKKALSFLDEANMVGAGNPNIESRVQLSYADIYFRKKDYRKARESAEKALLISDGKNADAMEMTGDIYKENNDIKNAAAAWQQALKLGGSKSRLLHKLESQKNN
jgi:tetratricopeptide (TPR) repeat protein